MAQNPLVQPTPHEASHASNETTKLNPLVPTCHPNKPHHAKGLCKSCYKNRAAYARYVPKEPKRYCPKGHDIRIVGRLKDAYCKACARKAANSRSYGAKLKRAYGIDAEQYQKMLANQNGVCAICFCPEVVLTKKGIPRRLSVDHDHKTGKVRSLLCAACNYALGTIKENATIARSMGNYIDYWNRILGEYAHG